ncbi:hypothetical protein HK096_004826 [Nowakowskiella sp. JEL0078]|nr:hypothetical protein HK096_004826 [Nowakowskiella sp. JEL0078]
MVHFSSALQAVLAVSLVTLVSIQHADAQTCVAKTSDLITVQNIPAQGLRNKANILVDNAGGSYGGVGLTYVFHFTLFGVSFLTGAAGVRVVPTDPVNGYWFFKFEPRECWDATGYNAFDFDFTAPVGSTFSMTLTVHTNLCLKNNCTANADSCPRAPDSTYVNINQFVVPNGKQQHVSVPFTSFDSNSFGNGTIDWRYIKDFTFIQFTTINQPYIFNNFIVKKGCKPTAALAVAATTAALGTTRPAAGTAVALTTAVAVVVPQATINSAATIAPVGTKSAGQKVNGSSLITIVALILVGIFCG